MSLINKMLRDLDARQAPNVDRSALDGMRTLPAAPARNGSRIAVGVLLLVAFAVWWRIMSLPDRQVVVVPPPLPVSAPSAAAPAAPPVPSAPVASPEPPPVSPPPIVESPPEPPPLPSPSRAAAGKAKPAPTPRAEKPAAAAVSPPPAAALATADNTPAAIDKRPRTAPVHEAADAEYRKGMTALRRGATSDALGSFRLALNLERTHVSARQALLSVLVEQQQWNEAQALVEEGLAADPTQVGWAMALARLQFEGGKLAQAGETLARHAAHAEQHADYLAFHALLLQKQKRHAESAQRYRAALNLRPSESRWWYGLGLALEAAHQAADARAAFQQARDSGNLPAELLPAVEQRLRQPAPH